MAVWKEKLERLNLRFRMFRPSSSSTFGLWLSLLRRNTKTTFWTISTSAAPCPILSKPAVVSSLCAFSRGIPYVSISHPNRGCDASAEALPTSGIVKEAQFSGLRILHQIIFRSQDAASQVQLPYCVYSTPPQQHRHSSLLPATDYRRFLNWVVMGCWGATPLVSLVTACIICRRRSLIGSHSRHPQPPPVVHWATDTLILPKLHQFIIFLVT